ncbi:hypothetical protein EV176_000240 [Coemansia sp. RSA 451]|nr:hypothetical protein EV176_000240 [Coemansia sp. RSA 451]
MQGNRPAPKTRPPFVGGQGAPSGQPRPPQQHHMQRPTQMGHANAGPRPRPSVRPGPGTGDSTDPSRWLAATMSTLPPDQQERLADLFRGLQSKAVDFTTFMRDAEAIMGPKFQDMLVLMRNRGPQASPMQQQQQRVQKFARPQPMPGMQQHATSSAMLRPGAAGPAQGPRPGIPHNLSASSSPMAPASLGSNLPTQAMLGGQLSDVNRNFALARQLLAQHGQASESDQIAGISGIGDLASLISSGSLSQGGSQADAGSGTLAAGAPGGQSFDMVISRWRQIILNPAIPNEQLAKLSMQLSAFGDHLVNATGPMAAIPEEERSQQFAQITKLQALIAQRQYVRGSAPQTPQTESRAGSPGLDMRGKDIKRKGTITMPKPKKRPADPRRQSSPAPRAGIKKQKTGADAGSDSDMETLTSRHGMAGPTLSLDSISSLGAAGSGRQLSGGHMHLAGLSVPQESFRGMQGSYVDVDDSMDMSASRNVISRTSTTGTGGHLSDNDDSSRFGDRGRHVDPMRERMGARDIQRRARERRDRDRSGSAMGSGSGGGDMFSIDDVIGYTGVDLREESEMILGSGMHHDVPRRLPSTYSMANQGPRLSTAIVGGVEVARDRALHIDFANPMVLEALVAKVCKGLHMRAVAADVVPYLSHALQERLRSYMELVSAAAYHRTRTQTLPPPPLDPTTRLPLYKITPHLDVKKQLMVIERVDKIREQVRQQQLVEREQYNAMDHTTQPDNEAGQAANDDEQQKSQTATEGGGVEARRGSDDGRRPAEGTGGDTGEQAKGIGAAKRSRKKDDANETPAYTSKNMPEELQNKISNLTALRAAGGVRKAWMTATSTPDWLSGASVGKQSQRIGVSDKAPPSPMAAPQESISGAKRTPSIGSGARMSGLGAELDMGSAGVRPPGHVRSRSSFGAGSDHDGSALATPTSERLSPAPYGMHRPQQPHMPHRSATLAAPLLVTVRDCLFSLERERLGGVRVGRGGGERVLIQAYAKYGHT